MNRTERRLWAQARTLADIGELTALWLEGAIQSYPCYGGTPDPETAPLVPVLAALNRAGVVTIASQPGFAGFGYDGALWEQRAAVETFAGSDEAVEHLAGAASAHGLQVIAHGAAGMPRWRYRTTREAVVTRRESDDYTWFGMQLSRRDIRSSWLGWGICERSAVSALCSAWQVTIVDPEWGRADSPLWTALASFAGLEAAA
jgi:hypothetical protein